MSSTLVRAPTIRVAVKCCSSLRWSSNVAKNSSKEVQKDQKLKVERKKNWPLFPNRDVPTSLNFPNPRGIPGYDPEVPLKQMIEEVPAVLKEHTNMLINEIKTSLPFPKKPMCRFMGDVEHNAARVEYTFQSPKDMKIWITGCDSDWNEGYSKCEFVLTDRKTAVFRGNIDSTLIKDGKTERAGWSAIKLEDKKAFLRKKYLGHWDYFTHLLIKCRGDGRSYKVMLYTPGSIDVTWGDCFAYPLHTHGGPYWQYEKIPFSRFIHTVCGRVQDIQFPIPFNKLSSIGIVLMDRIDGEFNLEIDFIGTWNDRSHIENHAYEAYTLRTVNPTGF